MSGPKCDYYELSNEYYIREQKRLERELREEAKRLRLEEERRKKEEKKKEEEQIKYANNFSNEMNKLSALLEAADKEEELNSQKNSYDDIYSEYLALTKLLEIEAIDFVKDAASYTNAIEAVNKEYERLKEELLNQRCRQEVNAIIDETIEKMGYELIADKKSKSKKEYISSLYKYDDNTAISMMSVNGQFTLEVVALDQVDRIVSNDEAIMLENKMKDFCQDYDKLKDLLDNDERLQGHNIYHMKPSKEYARIINTSIYTPDKRRRNRADEGDLNGSTYIKRRGTI